MVHALKGAPAFMLYCNRGRQLEPSVCSIHYRGRTSAHQRREEEAEDVELHLSGQRWGNGRLWRRLARAPEAVARRQEGLSLGVPSRPELPGAP